MSLTKKGSRTITVNNVVYRWSVRSKPTYSQGLVWSPLTFAVERADVVGTTLVVTSTGPRPDNWMLEPGVIIKPSDVARSIQAALSAGWIPTLPGKPFEFQLQSDT